jgi:curli biogenesis system outer membrane secretion channel CsgG
MQRGCAANTAPTAAKTTTSTAKVVVALLAGALALPAAASSPEAAPAAKARAPATGDPVRPTVGVLYFDYSGSEKRLEALRKGMAQMLISDLSAHETARIVERERLEAVLAEQKLGRSRGFDQRTAVRIGKLLGARYLVLGSYFDLAEALRVDARLVDVETGEVLRSVGAEGRTDDFLTVERAVATQLGEEVSKLPALVLPGRTPASAPPPPPPPSGRRPPPKPPRRLKTDTAVKYGQALAALDAGKRSDAKELLGSVIAAQPDFELASRDLERLMQ